MEIDPALLARELRYKLLIGGVVPRPIALISTQGQDGIINAAPFSFFNAVGSQPMTLLFCPANKENGDEKDSLRNAKPEQEGGRGEFVVNMATLGSLRQVVAAAEPLPPEDSELALTGLHAVPSQRVGCPGIREALLRYECRTRQVLRLAPGQGGGANIVIGEVVWVFVADGLMDERFRMDFTKLKAVGRMGGLGYCHTRDPFEVPMGRAALLEPELVDEGQELRAGSSERRR